MQVDTQQQVATNMQEVYTVGELATLLDIAPRKISDLFYARKIADDQSKLIGRMRLIPFSMLPAIREALGITGGEAPPPPI